MAKKIVVTTCSLHHLAQAKALGDSILKFNPDYKLIIGLVDKLNGRVLPEYYFPHELIEVETMHLPEFEGMYKRYTTLELNCALKSFFIDHVLNTYSPDFIFFLDSDILVFDSFKSVEAALSDHSILVTPHITSSFPKDDLRPQEKDILKTGIFNAGFLGLRNDSNGQSMIRWLKERMVDQCYERPKEGLNVDQKWLNLVPLFFESVKILLHAGCNIAYWNLHERIIHKENERYFVNNDSLIFYHYSGFSWERPEIISKHQDRFRFTDFPLLKELFDFYRDALIKNDHEKMLTQHSYFKKTKSGVLHKLGLKK
ncbi:MAG TPA: hypothetical protein VK588_14165 [Chitinophagaceae bacterium]|nr:hypothetical protein [Chitinophagaceae bacterium]